MSRVVKVVFGIDPGNAAAGLAVGWGGQVRYSCACDPWTHGGREDALDVIWSAYDAIGHSEPETVRPLVFIEKPEHGTHAAREGIMFAGGMLLGLILEARWPVLKSNVHKVKPSKWRRGIGLATKDSKARAERWAKAAGVSYSTVDELEARLICRYGLGLKLAD